MTGLERCAAEARGKPPIVPPWAESLEHLPRRAKIDARADFLAAERNGGSGAQILAWIALVALLALATAFWAWALPLPLFCAWLGVAGGWTLAQGDGRKDAP